MRPWLLLVSLLVSELSPLEDADWVVDYKRLLCRRRIRDGVQTISLSLAGLRRACECVAVQDGRRRPVFYWPHQVHRDTRQDVTGATHENGFQGLVCSLDSLPTAEERVPAFLVKSNTPPAPHVIGETSHVTMDVDKNRPDSHSARLHHRSAASGRDFPTFKTVDARLRNMLTSRNCTARPVIVSCCLEDVDVESTSKREVTRPRVGQREVTRPAADVRNPGRYGGRLSSVGQLDVIQSASVKASDTALGKGVRKQLPLSSASAEGVDGSSAQKPLKRSMNRPGLEMRPARDPNKEYFSGKVITEECELTCLEGESDKGKSRGDGVGNEGRESSANTDNVSLKPVVCDVGRDASIVLLLPEAETQTEPTNEEETVPYTDRKWKSVKILKELPHITKTAKGCKFKGQCFLEIYTSDRRKTLDIKPVKNRYKTGTSEATTATDEIPPKNVSTKEENTPSEGSFTPPPVTPAMTRAEGPRPETPGGVQGPASTNESPTVTKNPEPATNYEPEIRDYVTAMRETTTKGSLSGLRMKEDVQDAMDKLHKQAERESASASRMEAGREAGHADPGGALSKPREAVHKDVYQKMTGDPVPLCKGLIQRTEAGWKHCNERFRQPASVTFPSREAPDAAKLEKEPARSAGHNPPSNDDESNHFYYFNGVLKRVRHNFYPDNKGHRRRNLHNTAEREKEDAHGNLLSYIQSLNERNKVKQLK